ncbi:MAG: EAL domain-containing protein [bacterium]|nr:EAL domain-containing protein [bacterium]
MTTVSGPFRGAQSGDDRGTKLPSCNAVLEAIGQSFDAAGALGLLIIDGAFLGAIERRSGDQARNVAYRALSGLVWEVAKRKLGCDDVVMSGEAGRNEIWVAFPREVEDASLIRNEIPEFEAALQHAIDKNAGKAFYPHLRQAPTVVTGFDVCLRNPRFSAETQIFRAVEHARRGVELNGRVRARDRRSRFQQMLLDRNIHSVFEPIVEVETRVVFAYESLVRGPEDSEFRSPAALFGAAEEYDMVFELDCLCRRSGLHGAIDFPEGTKLFLNILPTAFHDPNFRADRLIKTLERCKLSPADVVFEISEQESIENFSVFKEARDYYRTLGFQFALDDTGSGYAGLEALLEISPEFIKMDRAFVSGVDEDPARQDLLAALLTLAEKMGARVIGEGLDTLEELEMLGELGIHFGQGWLFGHPTPLRAKD